jgi:hypothetical protein
MTDEAINHKRSNRQPGREFDEKMSRLVGEHRTQEDARAKKYRRPGVIPIGNAGGTYRQGD